MAFVNDIVGNLGKNFPQKKSYMIYWHMLHTWKDGHRFHSIWLKHNLPSNRLNMCPVVRGFYAQVRTTEVVRLLLSLFPVGSPIVEFVVLFL